VGLTIAESFKPNSSTSVLSGIVMRQDLIIDDFVFGYTTLECDDTTDMILKMTMMLEELPLQGTVHEPNRVLHLLAKRILEKDSSF
jgi:endonuclease V-like protein UPF0215 family